MSTTPTNQAAPLIQISFSLKGGQGRVFVLDDRIQVIPNFKQGKKKDIMYADYPHTGYTQILAYDRTCRTFCCTAKSTRCLGNVIHTNHCALLGCCGAQCCSTPMIYNVDDPYGFMVSWERAAKAYHKKHNNGKEPPISFYFPGNVRAQVMNR